MKKTVIKISAILATLAFAANAFAAVTISGSTIIGGGAFSPSKLVTIKAQSSGGAYAATSQHSQGTKQFGTVGGTGVTGDPTKIVISNAVSSGPTSPSSATALPSVTPAWQ